MGDGVLWISQVFQDSATPGADYISQLCPPNPGMVLKASSLKLGLETPDALDTGEKLELGKRKIAFWTSYKTVR